MYILQVLGTDEGLQPVYYFLLCLLEYALRSININKFFDITLREKTEMMRNVEVSRKRERSNIRGTEKKADPTIRKTRIRRRNDTNSKAGKKTKSKSKRAEQERRKRTRICSDDESIRQYD